MSREKMSANLPKAVVLAAFVNDPGKNLESLDQEREEIAKELGKNNDDFEFMVIQDATSENLWDHFSEYGKRIVAFHFAGHADGKAEKIILKDEAGNNRGTLMEALADAEGLLPMLQLVFLNGCATSSGVRHFTSHKKLVIATRAPVHDSIAKTFSVYFWKWLASNPSDNIITAFDYAKSRIKDLDPIAFKERFRDKTGVIENDETLVNQWDLYGLDKYDGSTQLFRGAYFASQLRVGSQKLYEENPLDKRLQQKGEELSHTFFDLSVVEQQTGHKANLIETLQRVYNHPVRHSMLLSAGGGGKTISLVNVWKHHLEEGIYPIPIFIRLNEINDCSGDAREDFISWYIATKYLGLSELTPDTAVFLKEWLSSDWKKPYPKLLLLLDGFNEITAGRSVEEKLLTDLKNRWRGEKKVEAQGIQIVVSSRYESDQAWTHGFARLEIQPIDETAVKRHLGTKYPAESDLQRLILNPLMLALYAASSTIWEKYKDDKSFEFKNQITNVAELMWNYLETQVVKQFVMYKNKESLYQAAHFFLKHFFPYLGFQMERQGLFQLSPDQLEVIIVQAKEQFLNPLFIKVFPRYKIGIREIDLEPHMGFVEETERLEGWIKRLVSRFHFLEVGSRDQKGNPASYSFIHQNFRDFFSAIHLRNLMEIGIYQNKILPEIHNRTWPAYLRQMVGELEVYNYFKNSDGNKSDGTAQIEKLSSGDKLLIDYLNLYKNQFVDTPNDYGIWNTVETWKQFYLIITEMDLSYLNLSEINFNNLALTQRYDNKIHTINLTGSLLDYNNLISEGHFGGILCVIKHPDLQEIIASDSEGVIKVWSLDSMKCRLTFKAHLNSANKVVFNKNKSTIISCSKNGNIREWDYITGKLIKTYKKEHKDSITDIRLNSNEQYLISASLDKQIKVWDTKTGESVKTLSGHTSGVVCVTVHPHENRIISGSLNGEIFQWADNKLSSLFCVDNTAVLTIKYNKKGDKILVGTQSGIALEYNISENKAGKIFPNHNGDVFDLLYNEDETSFFAASWEYPKTLRYIGLIHQWSLKDGTLIKTFSRHLGRVTSLCLDSSSNKLISGSYDRNIYEWSVETGRKLNEYLGKISYIWDIVRHPSKENSVLYTGTAK